jgi:hypothetical protein
LGEGAVKAMNLPERVSSASGGALVVVEEEKGCPGDFGDEWRR